MSKHKDEEGFAPIPEKSVATRQSCGALAMASGRGFEEPVDQTDLIIPRAQLLQPTAEGLRQLTKEHGVNAGDVINNLTKDKLPEVFVPIFYYKEYLRFNGRKKEDAGFDPSFPPGALMWRTRDANDPRVAEQCGFGENGEIPLALTTLNFFCLFEGESMPCVLSFAKTSYKAGKNLLSLAKLRGGDMFSRKYRLTTVETVNDQGTFFVMKVNPAGDCDQEMYATAEGLFNSFATKKDAIKDHVEGE